MKQPKIVIVDYGVGNVFSVTNAIQQLGYKKVVVSDAASAITSADALILPGVGAFDVCIKNLKEKHLDEILNKEVILNKKPLMGICVGMQMLATYSEENGIHNGLNWIPGTVKKLTPTNTLVVPHVGWNNISIQQTTPLFDRNQENTHFYFDHSYHFECDFQYLSATCQYGLQVTAAIQKDNIFGVQFHPEKSQTSGLKLFRSFISSI